MVRTMQLPRFPRFRRFPGLPALFLAALCVANWPGTAAAQDVNPSDMVTGALQVLRMIDQGETGDLWDGAAPAARKRIARGDFIAQVAKAREALGTVQQRTWVAVNRQVVTHADAEVAGQYLNVDCESRFTQRPDAVVREMVSFQLGSDRVWRFSGYFIK